METLLCDLEDALVDELKNKSDPKIRTLLREVGNLIDEYKYNLISDQFNL